MRLINWMWIVCLASLSANATGASVKIAPKRHYAIEIAPDAGLEVELASVLNSRVAVDWTGSAAGLVQQLATQLGLPYSTGGAGAVAVVSVHQSNAATVADAMRTVNAQLPPAAVLRVIRTTAGYRMELTPQDSPIGQIVPVDAPMAVPPNSLVNAGSTAVVPGQVPWGSALPSQTTVYQEATPGRSPLLTGPGIEPESQSSSNWVQRARARWKSQVTTTP